jgi:hypothetical protein
MVKRKYEIFFVWLGSIFHVRTSDRCHLPRVSGLASPVKLDQPRPAKTATTSNQFQVNTPLSAQNNSVHSPRAQLLPAVDRTSWDGWPNGSFVLFLKPQQIRNTNSLAVQWSSEAFGPQSKGSHLSGTWQRSRASSADVWELSNALIRFAVFAAHAIRGIHISQQLEECCLCGAILEHRQCTVHWTVHIYGQGARFENFGEHSHPLLSFNPASHFVLHRPSLKHKCGTIARSVGYVLSNITRVYLQLMSEQEIFLHGNVLEGCLHYAKTIVTQLVHGHITWISQITPAA